MAERIICPGHSDNPDEHESCPRCKMKHGDKVFDLPGKDGKKGGAQSSKPCSSKGQKNEIEMADLSQTDLKPKEDNSDPKALQTSALVSTSKNIGHDSCETENKSNNLQTIPGFNIVQSNPKPQTVSSVDNVSAFDSPVDLEKQTWHFHAIMAPVCRYDQYQYSVFIEFMDAHENWDDQNRVLMSQENNERDPSNGYGYYFSVQYPVSIQKKKYRYVLQKKDKSEVCIETYICRKNKWDHARGIYFSNTKDVWNQYDGYVYFATKQKIKEKLKERGNWGSYTTLNMSKIRKIHGKQALSLYMPDILEATSMGEKLTRFKDVLCGSLPFHFREKKEPTYNKQSFIKAVRRIYIEPNIAKLSNMKAKDNTQSMILGVLILLMLDELQCLLSDLSEDSICLLFEALIVSNDCQQIDSALSTLEVEFCKYKYRVYVVLVRYTKEIGKMTNSSWFTRFKDWWSLGKKEDLCVKKSTIWLYMLPLIHKFEDFKKPFKEIDFDSFDFKLEEWWCFEHFKEERGNLLTQKWVCDEVLSNLQHVFEADTELQRAFMASVRWNDFPVALKEDSIVLEVGLAAFFRKLMEVNKKQEDFFQIPMQCMQIFISRLKKSIPMYRSVCENRIKVMRHLFASIWTSLKEIEAPNANEYFDLLILGGYCNVSSASILSNALQTGTKDISGELNDMVKVLSRSRFLISKTFSLALQINVEPESLPEWNDTILKHFQDCLQRITNQSLWNLWTKQVPIMKNESLKDLLEQSVVSRLEDIMVTEDIDEKTMNENLYRRASEIFDKTWKISVDSTATEIMNQLLSWKFSIKYLVSFKKNGELVKRLTEMQRDIVKGAMEIFNATCKSLISGDVDFEMTDIIIANIEEFQNAIKGIFEENHTDYLSALGDRNMDLISIKFVIKNIETLKEVFQEFEISFHDDPLINLSRKKIKDLCDLTPQKTDYKTDVKFCASIFSETIYFFLREADNIKTSYSFKSILRSVSSDTKESKRFCERVENCLKFSVEKWKKICEGLADWTITFKELKTHFPFSLKDKTVLCEELKTVKKVVDMKMSDWDISTLENTIIVFPDLGRIGKLVGSLLQIKTLEENLSGDFSSLQAIRDSIEDEIENITIQDIQRHRQIFDELKDKTEEKNDCLQSFLECRKLICWLRETMKNGMKDLKSYSDLALMSLDAESEDRSMRVTNLHTVTMAYSPLIFNYMNIKGEKELIRKCSEIWECQEKDPDLPRKLGIAQQFLNWFKTLKETHGHVELNSLKQVDLIIEKGVFFVGKTNFLFRANEKYFHNLLRTGDENVIGFKVTDTIKELSTSLSKCKRVVILDDPDLASRVRGKIGRESCCVTSASTEKLHSADLKYSYNGNYKDTTNEDASSESAEPDKHDEKQIFVKEIYTKKVSENDETISVNCNFDECPIYIHTWENEWIPCDKLIGLYPEADHILSGNLALNDIISLVVPNREDTEVLEEQIPPKETSNLHQDTRNYTLREMRDLQSRLMLVAGEETGKTQNIDRFTSMFEYIVRLGTLIIKMRSAGCILFDFLNFEFHCGKGTGNCVIIKSALSSVEDISCRNTARETGMDRDLYEYLKIIVEVMESSYKKWKSLIKENREKYHDLNAFTVEQLMILQVEIAKFMHEQTSSNSFLFHLLHFVKKDCTENDLRNALQEAREDIFKMENKTETAQEPCDTERKDEQYWKDVDAFLKLAEQKKFSRKLALYGIQINEINVRQPKEGLKWCLRNSKKYEAIIPTTTEERPVRQTLKAFAEEIEKELRNQTMKNVKESLENVWIKFATSSSASDYLSVNDLGLILLKLKIKDAETKKSRHLQDPLQRGKPNLIVCRKDEIISNVIGVYMMKDQKDSNFPPLPSRNEVLFCNEDTTIERVDMFFRRCLFPNLNSSEDIYCLVNADLLTYAVSETSIKILSEYISKKKSSKSFQLIFVCDIENEHISPIISAYEKQKRNFETPPPESINEYLTAQFKCDSEKINALNLSIARSSVQVVRSERSGMGKTLWKTQFEKKVRLSWNAEDESNLSESLHLSQCIITYPELAREFLDWARPRKSMRPRIFHVDIAAGVENHIDAILFNLLVLGSIEDDRGRVFNKTKEDIYLIEVTYSVGKEENGVCRRSPLETFLNLLPSVLCISPKMSLTTKEMSADHIGFDEEEFESDAFQRPCHYLECLERRERIIPIFQPFKMTNAQRSMEAKRAYLEMLLKHCCVEDPSWYELRNFVSFLNVQLLDFEKSVFCSDSMRTSFEGFSIFVLKFLIQMARDFSTQSSVLKESKPKKKNYLDHFMERKTWETSPHPYLFFNQDKNTITFLGFNIERKNRHIIDPDTGKILKEEVMTRTLWEQLHRNGVPLTEKFDELTREQKLERLWMVMGNEEKIDPDNTYELTADNVKKMLAIYMRFRCNIPVVVMGETGCGKTRLVRFLCSLQCSRMKTLVVMKVHGGTTKHDIMKKVEKAEELAIRNSKENKRIYTVLFFDEANTTDAIGTIKEIMCDGTLNGKKMDLYNNLKLVAACNPYRQHSEEMIERLEKAGLGFLVHSAKTLDKLGGIPKRNLVYRVHPLPESMLPLVWDFGQLSNSVEKLYIRQMIESKDNKHSFYKEDTDTKDRLCEILAEIQAFMREQKDECSFVSLRDIERTLYVMDWFTRQATLSNLMNRRPVLNNDESTKMEISRALILAIGVCYYCSLKNREKFVNALKPHFKTPFHLGHGIEEEIKRCQEAFLQNIDLSDNIAQNIALRENFFMMVLGAELRIPIFLVGKPGSSKSLSKVLLDHNMQGQESISPLFQTFKQIQMVCFQCSPHATSEGILLTFKQAASFQKDKDLNRFTSIVVLDEIGLAEDSPKMPLKVLHALLEDGLEDDDDYENFTKVAFIGISNWALDPAKMNRGIMVQRDELSEQELETTARGILKPDMFKAMSDLIEPLTKGYLDLIDFVGKELKREFFGLRDFYSLLKMLCEFTRINKRKPDTKEILYSIARNFDGLENCNPLKHFQKHLGQHISDDEIEDQNSLKADVLLKSLTGDEKLQRETRYILLMKRNISVLTDLFCILENKTVHVLYGSCFPKDNEYIQICRKINEVKVYMGTPSTVILINLDNIYESLYDVMNQYYMELDSKRYVDLGLGTHRVKCSVHPDFRLVLVATNDAVYKKFPIPLINRLEKHQLSWKYHMSPMQESHSKELTTFLRHLSNNQTDSHSCRDRKYSLNDVLIGFNDDTLYGVLWEASKNCTGNFKDIIQKSHRVLLAACTPDSLARMSVDDPDREELLKTFSAENHDSLHTFVQHLINTDTFSGSSLQITTHSKLISEEEVANLETDINILKGKTCFLNLQTFDTEHQFNSEISDAIERGCTLLLIQCSNGVANTELINCARYCVQRKIKNDVKKKMCVAFIVSIPRLSRERFTSFQTGVWKSFHIDELRKSNLPALLELTRTSIGDLMTKSPLLFSALIGDCLHEAVSRINDKQGPEAVGRVKHLQTLMSDEKEASEETLSSAILNYIMREVQKQETGKGDFNLSWVMQAAATENVNKAGTFRASCHNIIKQRITPILAKVIASIDTNYNLLLFNKHDFEAVNYDWKSTLWLDIMTTKETVRFLEQQYKHEPRIEMINMDNRDFKAKFPFSWIVSATIRNIWDALVRASQVGKIETREIQSVFANNEISQCLSKIRQEDANEAIEEYISDFLRMTHKTGSDMEEKAICRHIRCLMPEEFRHPISQFFVLVQSIYCERVNEIRRFSQIIETLPEHRKDICESTKIGKMIDVHAGIRLLGFIDPECNSELDKELDTDEGQSMWLTNVQKCRSVIETTLRLRNSTSYTDPTEKESIECLHQTWSKVIALKLYIENVHDVKTDSNASDDNPEANSQLKNSTLLWQLLPEKTNFKSKETLDTLEEFLLLCNKNAVDDFIGIYGACQNCGSEYEGSPLVQLPCDHKICKGTCFSSMRHGSKEMKCPMSKCGKVIPSNFNENEHAGIKRENMKKFTSYQESCNTFYMKVVSQLCFENNSPPDKEVIKKLSSLITSECVPEEERVATLGRSEYTKKKTLATKRMCIFDTTTDITPVFRSFLLQLLIRTNSSDVYEHLSEFFKNASQCVQNEEGKGKHLQEICMLLIQCIEDNLHEKITKQSCRTWQDVYAIVAKMLHETKEKMIQCENRLINDVLIMQDISSARYGLRVVSRCLYEIYFERKEKTSSAKELLREASDLCCLENKHIRFFLLRDIYTSYGVEMYNTLLTSEEEWLFRGLDKPDLDMKIPDYCAILGGEYTDTRNVLISKMSLERVGAVIVDRHNRQYFMVALAQMIYTYPEEYIFKMKGEYQLLKDKQVQEAEDMVDDRIAASKYFDLNDTRQTAILILLAHLKIVLGTRLCKNICQPLYLLAHNPATLKKTFLPTMPDVNLEGNMLTYTPKMIQGKSYVCPNNHIYFIGDCGEPRSRGKCIECGESVGGIGYVSDQGNRKYKIDNTFGTGHILGRACDRNDEGIPERDLSSSECALLRIFTHLSMMLGCRLHVQDVGSLMIPPLPEDDRVEDFLKMHIDKDLKVLCRVFQQNMDLIFMLLHSIIQSFATESEDANDDTCSFELTTRNARKKWEAKFAEQFFKEKLKEQRNFFKNCVHTLENDQWIKCLLKEEISNASDIEVFPSVFKSSTFVWQFKRIVSYEHFVQEFNTLGNQNKTEKFLVLKQIIEEAGVLQLIRHLPKILDMQNIFKRRLNRQKTREELNTLTIRSCLLEFEKDPAIDIINEGISAFVEAWKSIWPFLTFEKDIHKKEIDIEKDKISLLVCGEEEFGLSVIGIILRFLSGRQNVFLENCRKWLYLSPDVTLDKINQSSVICYDKDTVMLPILLANCNYTYAVDKGLTMEFDFEGIQDTIIDQILFGKANILLQDWPYIVYRADASYSTKFSSLHAKIPQEPIPIKVQAQIIRDFPDLPDIYDAVDRLEIIVDFLLAVNEDKEKDLLQFMEKSIKMKTFSSATILQFCKLKHVKALWSLLILDKSKRMHSSGKDAFDGLRDGLKIKIEDSSRKKFQQFVRKISKEKLNFLLQHIMDFILFFLNKEDMDEMQYSLKDAVIQYIQGNEYQDLAEDINEDLEEMSDDIIIKHVVDAWTIIFDYLQSREK